MIRLAVICLPLLAMACASADVPDSNSSLPELQQMPSFYGPNCQRGRQYGAEDWQRGLPPGVSNEEVAASLRSTAALNAQCNVQAFAVRQREPLEYWFLCEYGPMNLRYRPNASEGDRARQVVTSCNPGRPDAPMPDPLNVINQGNTQERSD